MKTDEPIIATVIESYAHDKHQIVTARCPDDVEVLHFNKLYATKLISFRQI